jgi:hypothetical protein
MPAQVGKDEAVTGDQSLGRWLPEIMIGGKRMEQYDRWTASNDFIEYFGIVASDLRHAKI